MSESIPDFPRFPPIELTPAQARQINDSINARLGDLSDEEIDRIATALEEAGQRAQQSRDFVREIARVLLATFLPKL